MKNRPLLKTKYTPTTIPFTDYPRPTMVRDSYLSLNGKWHLTSPSYTGDILVPYPPESLLSTIGRHVGDNLTYEREFSLPDGFLKDRVILHFGAVDQISSVYLNDTLVTTHVGGYMPFCVDITDYLKEKNLLRVEVVDELDTKVLPYGKQTKSSKGMWYTLVTGIWQSVWLESVGCQYIKGLNVKVLNCNKVKIEVDGVDSGKITLDTPSGLLNYDFTNGQVEIDITDPVLWSPENPYLYHYSVKSEFDEVRSYFAIRTIGIVDTGECKRIALNGKPYFLHGILDQGYWSDGLFLPANTDAYVDEIKRLKALGFNTIRKHVKVEPEIFYYLCDKLGIIVMQDMVNNGKYSFFRDTLLPNIGISHKKDTNAHKCIRTRKAFLDSLTETITTLSKHPSICYWTIFNEGWGQFCADTAYEYLKTLDDTRIIDATSGWFHQTKSDVLSLHSYFFKPKIVATKRACILSEFGGGTYKVEGHNALLKTYGYGSCKSREEFVKRVRDTYRDIIKYKKMGLSGSVYTQVSDIEDEINGLFTYDREIEKIYPHELIDLSRELTKED